MKILAALHAKASQLGFRLAIISGEGPITPSKTLEWLEQSKLTSVVVSHISSGDDGANAFMAIRNATGVPYSDILLFAGERSLYRAGNRAGATSILVPGSTFSLETLLDGLTLFGQQKLDGRGF
jgi:hypothetical protein